MNDKHKLLLLVGRTSSGKSTLANMLQQRCGLSQIISYTTRQKRNENDNDHIFVDEEAYKQMRECGDVAAYTEISGKKYWSTISQLYENDIYVIDPKGIETLKEMNLDDIELVTVYINTPDDVRKDRALNKRKDDKAQFLIRDRSEKRQFEEFLKNSMFDYAVQNIDIPSAYSILKWICTVKGMFNKGDKE